MLLQLALLILLLIGSSFTKVIQMTSIGAKCDSDSDDADVDALQKDFHQANSGNSIEFSQGKT